MKKKTFLAVALLGLTLSSCDWQSAVHSIVDSAMGKEKPNYDYNKGVVGSEAVTMTLFSKRYWKTTRFLMILLTFTV
jgi:lipoprotein